MPEYPNLPRIPPLPVDEQDDEVKELLAGAGVQDALASNIFTTLVRHRGLFRKWVPFGGKLLSGKLNLRDREILILRTGWLCKSEYEYGQHSLIALQNGFTKDELDGVKFGAAAPCWNPLESALVKVADELHFDATISTETWSTLASNYNEQQLIEIPMLVGQYHLVAFTLNSLGVQREPGVPGFGD
jgi:4-carboxymuconolactone decarboxylase